MVGRKNVVQLEYNSDVDSLIKDIDKLITDTNKPELVYVKMSSKMFPRRVLDLPEKLRKLLCRNPSVKLDWSNNQIPQSYVKNPTVYIFSNAQSLSKLKTLKDEFTNAFKV
jgi:hypothetical protein